VPEKSLSDFLTAGIAKKKRQVREEVSACLAAGRLLLKNSHSLTRTFINHKGTKKT
jgi:hypothetical protein